ncbi:MAG: thioredoxin domain-containing protein [Gammaproteobacteria bacterium]|nr:thioredoxin domain-containing protein [Gammaproteobacteria bacterium]
MKTIGLHMPGRSTGNHGVALGGLALAAALAVFGVTQVHAQTSTADREAMVEQIKQEVLQDLLEKGELDAAIDAGIQRYILEQRRAQAEARARQESASAALAKNVRPVSASRDHIYGDPDAEISLIEYSDFECPFCKRFHATPKEIVDAYDGRVNWVYRHFPLGFHNPGAQKQAEASECAAAQGGNEAFWRYTDLIYERTTSNGQGFPLGDLVPLAEEIGLDGEEFGKCLAEERFADRVMEDYEEGLRAGISGTPGNILLNNKSGEVISRPGAASFDVLKELIDRLLGPSG